MRAAPPAWTRRTLGALLAASLLACGDSGPGPGVFEAGMRPDAGLEDGGPADASMDASNDGGGTDGRGPKPPKESGPAEGGPPDGTVEIPDTGFTPDCDQDLGCAPPRPEAWTCPNAFWADDICDCGCTERDVDCLAGSCTEPGCVDAQCGACFTLEGSWKACEPEPDSSAWQCDPLDLADGSCDCGCGIPDPACNARGCTTPACRTGDCDSRAGCAGPDDISGNGDDVTLAAEDDCSSVNPQVLFNGGWDCAWNHYGAQDGCDCGCGADDPDCVTGGCTTGSCWNVGCETCHDADGRPVSCAAAEAGWTCNTTRYDANDGCDCGCGAADPDCGGDGCTSMGCDQAACDRCTDMNTGQPTGCSVPMTWTDNACDTDNYGTGDGCDCGCGVDDPDCGVGEGCTTNSCTDSGCDICNDGAGFFVECDDWSCSSTGALDAACDCGCGVVDPYCREVGRRSCTGDGCEVDTCEYCTDTGTRSACGGEWEADNGADGSACDVDQYGMDGLCDCGCGVKDPDCKASEGCTEKGCHAEGCEVCHLGNSLIPCLAWTCDDDANGSGDGCDCGCGAPDPDCGNGGCVVPGCGTGIGDPVQCETCHDPNGREVECP